MKIAAIIAEYNPFHKGHQYQIAQTRRLTGASYVLVLLSGDFVQRGAPALYNKYLRTRMALLGGADVVLELPARFALSSAEYFAQGGVTLLNQLGVEGFLSFGSEQGELSAFRRLAPLLLEEPALYRQLLSDALKQGLSYPAARSQALTRLLPEEKSLPGLLNSPNNILGLEYCKALLATDSPWQPFTLARQGFGYHDTLLSSEESPAAFASASGLRRHLAAGADPALLREQLPQEVFALCTSEDLFHRFLQEQDFSLLLHYRLLSGAAEGFADYLDCTPDISDKIRKHLPDYQNFQQFCLELKSRDLTATRIRRILLHILLGLKTPAQYALPVSKRQLAVPYARLLGFRREAGPLLALLKAHSSLPLISKPADAGKLLDENGLALFREDVRISHIYEAVWSARFQVPACNEYRQSPLIL